MILILIFILGTLIGSFLNVVILRLPEERKLTGRSACMHCGHVLKPWELVPLFSYILLRGKCSSCKKRISPRYFTIEALTGLLFVLGFTVLFANNYIAYILYIKYLILACTLVVVFVIDFEHYLIFDSVIFPILAAMLVCSLCLDILSHSLAINLSSYFVTSILGALAGSLPFFLIWYFSDGKWMGFGDVKLMLLLGGSLGLSLVPVVLLLAIMSGGIVSVYLLSFTKLTLKSKVPFGTFLAASCLVTFLWGHQLIDWYLALMGF